MGDPEDVEQVDLVELLPHVGLAPVERPHAHVVPDVVHEHVDASVRAEHVLPEPVDVGVDAHVGGEHVGVASGGHDLVGRLRRGFGVDVGDHDGRSVLSEERGRRASDSVPRRR